MATTKDMNTFFGLIANKTHTVEQLEKLWKTSKKNGKKDKTDAKMVEYFDRFLKNYEGDKTYVKTTTDLFDFMFINFPLTNLKEFIQLKKYPEFKEWMVKQEKDELDFVLWMRKDEKKKDKDDKKEVNEDDSDKNKLLKELVDELFDRCDEI